MERSNSLSRLAETCTACLITLFGMGLILCTGAVSAAAADTIVLCGRVVIPSLFPFLVLSSLCLSTGMGRGLCRLLSHPMERLFHLPGSGAPALVLGLIGGYPVGARTVFDLYDRKGCSAEECSRLLAFCSCCGPAFLCSAVGVALFGSLRAGLMLYGCHVGAALVIGLVQGRFLPKPDRRTIALPASPSLSFARAFTQAVGSACGAMLNVCAFVVFFAALMALLEDSGCMGFLKDLLRFLPKGMAEPLVRGLLEMTGGVAALGETTCLTFPQAMGLAGGMAGWGGLSVHAQVLALREERDIPMGRYFTGKLFHGLLAGCLSFCAAFYCLPESAHHPVFQPLYGAEGVTVLHPLYYILICGVYLLACLAVTALVIRLEDRDTRKDGCQTGGKSV